jgi:hypothetical protein
MGATENRRRMITIAAQGPCILHQQNPYELRRLQEQATYSGVLQELLGVSRNKLGAFMFS